MWRKNRNDLGETPQQEMMRRLEAVEALAQQCADRDNRDDSRWLIHESVIRGIQRKQMGLPPLETIEPSPDQETLPDILNGDVP